MVIARNIHELRHIERYKNEKRPLFDNWNQEPPFNTTLDEWIK